ncbi:MAG TPA: cyclopropane-fatty-acyl-phospholipid synthase family protein [Methylovirgula sp.]|nr:cyclopropane-fatty-acyl-phospholipid synthase family protein [Methylovirgula sp.]
MDQIFRSFISGLIKTGSLEIETASGQRFRVGDGSGENVRIRFADRAAEWALMRDPGLRFGELYMDGRVTVEEGSIYDVLAIASRNVARFYQFPWLAAAEKVRAALNGLATRNTLVRARRNATHHYDLDSRLYSLFLDTDRQYSCAYFESPSATLEEAQLAKKRHIAAKLLIEPGNRVLDIGCGWGGLALYLARICNAKVTGITLSREQLCVARRRAAETQQASALDFRLQDYREVGERFDRIVSVGMFEHVGRRYYDTFFRQIAKLLDSDGVALLHTIGSEHSPQPTDPWIAKYIFPGGYIPSLSQITPSIEKAGLIVTDVEVLRLHYAETLRSWRERFLAHRAQAAALYDERFCRMWEYYLSGAECGFRFLGQVVFQIQLAKKIETVPMTRDYIVRRETELRRRDTATTGLRIAG